MVSGEAEQEKALSDEALVDALARLAAHIDAASYRLLCLIREVDQRQLWADGFRSCAHWLNYRIGLDLVTAREKVRVALALAHLPKISAAFERGQLSYSKVRAITRVATETDEEDFLNLALAGTASHLETIIRAYRKARRCGEDDIEQAQRQNEARYLQVFYDDQGMLVIRGRLPPVEGACVLKALEAAETLVQKQQRQPPKSSGGDGTAEGPVERDEPQGASAAFGEGASAAFGEGASAAFGEGASAAFGEGASAAFGEGASAAFGEGASAAFAGRWGALEQPGSSVESCDGPQVDSAEFAKQEATLYGAARPSDGERRADALAWLAQAALSQGVLGTERHEPYQVVVHVDAQVLADPLAPGQCALEHGPALAVQTARRVACDASVIRLRRGARGRPLDVGRKTRQISTPLWRALVSRDRRCTFPGCLCTRNLKAHHIRHWAAGGPTTLENLTLLCNAHHWAAHEGNWRIRGQAPDRLTFLRPNGGQLLPAVRPPGVNGDGVEVLEHQHRALRLGITAETNAIDWMGERLNLDWIVTGLMESHGA